MTTLPADWDYANALLSLFDARHVGPGGSLPADLVRREFQRSNMGKDADYEAALTYSTELGWLRCEFGRLRLTRAGFEAL